MMKLRIVLKSKKEIQGKLIPLRELKNALDEITKVMDYENLIRAKYYVTVFY